LADFLFVKTEFRSGSSPCWSSKGASSKGRGKSGLGSFSKRDSLLNWGFAYNLCHSTFEIDFLCSSSTIIHTPSLPAKKMKGMWQKRTTIKDI
jgi:hypothetical protein